MPKSENFYAVRVGKKRGIYSTWEECREQTKGFRGAKFQKFTCLSNAEAFVYGVPPDSPIKETAPLDQFSKVQNQTVEKDEYDGTGWDDVVYTDGSCRGNGTDVSVAGIGVWWGENDQRNLAERCPGEQTNNRAELIAIIRVLEITSMSKRSLMIRTDSRYSIWCFEKWLPKWRLNGFQTCNGHPVKNASIIKYLSSLLDERAKYGQKIRLQHVKGHSGERGNDGADMQANKGALQPYVDDRDWDQLEASIRQSLGNTFQNSDAVDLDPDPKDFIEILSSDDDAGSPKTGKFGMGNRTITPPSSSPISPLRGSQRSISGDVAQVRSRSNDRHFFTVESSPQPTNTRGEFPSFPTTPTKTRNMHTSTSPSPRLSDVSGYQLGYHRQLTNQAQFPNLKRSRSPMFSTQSNNEQFYFSAPKRLLSQPKLPSSLVPVDLDLFSDPLKSPSKTARTEHLPSASARYKQVHSPRASFGVIDTPLPKLSASDIDPEVYAGCLADEDEMINDLRD